MHFLSAPPYLSAVLLACLAWPLPAPAQQVTIYRCTDAAGTLTVQNQPCPAGSSQREQQLQGVASSPSIPAAASPALVPASVPAPAGAMPATGALQSAERSSDGGFVTTSSGSASRAPSSAGFAGFPDAQAPQRSADGGFITTSVGPEPRILDSANLPRERDATAATAADDADRLPPPPIFRCTVYDGDSYLSEDEEVPPRCLPLRTVGLDGNPATGAGQACEVVRDTCARVADGAACEAWRRHAREAESRWRFAHPDNAERRQAEYERMARIVSESCGG